MAKSHPSQALDTIHTSQGDFRLKETVRYANGGSSYFYAYMDMAIIVDDGLCEYGGESDKYEYSQITSKQNEYMSQYDQVYRFMEDDVSSIEHYLCSVDIDTEAAQTKQSADRAEQAEPSLLERDFEEHFAQVYGPESLNCLWREYGITDLNGSTRYLDYLIRTDTGDIAVEENGVTYHHPQAIGPDKYRTQLLKQNSCTAAGIKLFRFSSEDCRFTDRFEDDIRAYFGDTAEHFKRNGLVADRAFQLYDHQAITLEEIDCQRKSGSNSFLIVFPTASGKSKIVEQDLASFAEGRSTFRALILVPNNAIKQDWQSRVAASLSALSDSISIQTYVAIERHYSQYTPNYFDYIVVDEAHHAVAPGLKRAIQYFEPEFLIGLTATDQRPDKRKLETVFGTYRVGLSLKEAMEKGIIARANAYRIETNVDLSRVRINGKEYVNADLEKTIRVTSRNQLIADVLKEYFCDGDIGKRQGVVFCVNEQHVREMERVLTNAGIKAKAYTSKSKDPQKIMRDFRNGEYRFLCACQMISEGWDYPELGILVMARPTLSKVLYLQQLGRGLRRTPTKGNVFVIDVVDEYGSAVMPCSLHSIFGNNLYVPFGDILRTDYRPGELIEISGLEEQVLKITEVDIFSFAEKYGDYLSVEQLARQFFVSTDTVSSWVKKGQIAPTVIFAFGSKKVHLFSPADAESIRVGLEIPEHSDLTIRDDFFAFLAERDYSLSYKMPFLLSFLDNIDASGDARIDDVLHDYIAFYANRIEKGLMVDRATCPYNTETLAKPDVIRKNMLTNPFEKFERKRFMYYSKELGVISMNHALHAKLMPEDYDVIKQQMNDDLKNYYENLNKGTIDTLLSK